MESLDNGSCFLHSLKNYMRQQFWNLSFFSALLTSIPSYKSRGFYKYYASNETKIWIICAGDLNNYRHIGLIWQLFITRIVEHVSPVVIRCQIVLNLFLSYFWNNADDINPLSAKFNYLIFHPPEVASCYRDPQLLVGEKYSYMYLFQHMLI